MADQQISVINDKISLAELKIIAQERFGDLIKAVVDIEKQIMAIGGEMHFDEEQILLEQGSKQENLWGISLYPDLPSENFIEFDSMINIRPRQNNRSREVESEEIKNIILNVVKKLVQ